MKLYLEPSLPPEAVPEHLALAFWALSSEDQAAFFNSLGRNSEHRLALRLSRVVMSGSGLNAYGRCAMQVIGNYGAEAQV